MIYGKIENGVFTAHKKPNTITTDEWQIFNPTDEQILEHTGFKPVVEDDIPTCEAGEAPEAYYEEDETTVFKRYRKVTVEIPKPPEPTEEMKRLIYCRLVQKYIREKYSVEDEIAMIRQKEEKPEEYAAYFDYCEECKQKAREGE